MNATATATQPLTCTELQEIASLPCPDCDAPAGQPCEAGCYGSLGAEDMAETLTAHLTEVHGVTLTADEASDPFVLLARHQAITDVQ